MRNTAVVLHQVRNLTVLVLLIRECDASVYSKAEAY